MHTRVQAMGLWGFTVKKSYKKRARVHRNPTKIGLFSTKIPFLSNHPVHVHHHFNLTRIRLSYKQTLPKQGPFAYGQPKKSLNLHHEVTPICQSSQDLEFELLVSSHPFALSTYTNTYVNMCVYMYIHIYIHT